MPALPDAVAGSKLTPLSLTWQDEDGTVKDLSGATITARIKAVATGVASAATGTFAVTSSTGGVFTWSFSAADVQTAGNYTVQFKATVGGLYDLSYEHDWTVKTAI